MIKFVKKIWMWILAVVGVVIAIATLGNAVKKTKVRKIKKDIKENQKEIEKNQSEQRKLQEKREAISAGIKENDKKIREIKQTEPSVKAKSAEEAAKSLKRRLNRSK